MSRWFRFYDEVLDDPKVQQLPDALYRRWTDFLCVASRNDGHIPGDAAALGFVIRQPAGKVKTAINALTQAGLLDKDGDGYTPHGWQARQYSSDSSAERMRRHRQRKRDDDVTSHPPSHDPSPPPSRSRTSDGAEQNRTEQSRTETTAAAAVPVAETASAEADQRHALGQRVLEAAKIDPARWLGTWGLISAWQAAGYDPELDILPTIRAVAARDGYEPPRSLKYFTDAIERAWRERCLDIPAALQRPAPATGPEAERARLEQTPGTPEHRYSRAVDRWARNGAAPEQRPNPAEFGIAS